MEICIVVSVYFDITLLTGLIPGAIMKNFDDENKMPPERYEEVKLKVRTALHIYGN